MDLRRKGEAQLVPPDGQRPRKCQCHRLVVVVVSDGGATRLLVDRGARDLHAVGVKHDPRSRLAHLDVDDLEAVDLEAVRVELEIDVVVDGNDGLRQPAVVGAARRGGADRGQSQRDQQRHGHGERKAEGDGRTGTNHGGGVARSSEARHPATGRGGTRREGRRKGKEIHQQAALLVRSDFTCALQPPC